MLRITIIALYFLTPFASRALTIEEPFQSAFSSDVQLDSYVSNGFIFPDDADANAALQPLLGPIPISPVNTGVSHFADATAGTAFQQAVASLTNGTPGAVELGTATDPSNPFSSYGGQSESQIFADDPLGTHGVDLAGFRIERIGFRPDQVTFGRDDQLQLYTYQVSGTLFFEGERLFEPASAGLVVLGLFGLLPRLKRRVHLA
jgi:hypothetical protein